MRPKNIDLYRRAFVHKSLQKYINATSSFAPSEVPEYMKESFERLEFVGDSTLNLVIAKMLYQMFPQKDEGFLTRLRTKIVRGTNCSNLAKKLDLGKWILTGNKFIKGSSSLSGPQGPAVINDRLLEDVFESLIGAIELDLGHECAEQFILEQIKKYIDVHSLACLDDNFKDILMRFTQVNGFELPIYENTDVQGPPHNRIFTVTMSLKKGQSKVEYGIGQGSTKKDAEQNACKDSICFKKLKECNIHTCTSPKIHLDSIEHLINRDHEGLE
jgi:ribonuclease-3